MKIVFDICYSRIECGNPQSKAALQLAMFNLEKRFAVVGVMEQFETSIAVMEAMLPRSTTVKKIIFILHLSPTLSIVEMDA